MRELTNDSTYVFRIEVVGTRETFLLSEATSINSASASLTCARQPRPWLGLLNPPSDREFACGTCARSKPVMSGAKTGLSRRIWAFDAAQVYRVVQRFGCGKTVSELSFLNDLRVFVASEEEK
jgi:hypothetical protein